MTLTQVAEWVAGKLGTHGRDLEEFMHQQAAQSSNERFRQMDRYEAYYWGLQHDQKAAAWDGRPVMKDQDRANFEMFGMAMNPTFQDTPWYMRRPYVRKQLAPAIVDRFTGLLFGDSKRPQILSADPEGQEWLNELLKRASWWQQMSSARSMGGAVGAVVIGVEFVNGVPVVEVANAKHCTPIWKDDKRKDVLQALEIKYKHPVWKLVQVRQLDGSMASRKEEQQEWYWRIINEVGDVVLTAPVAANGREPDWTIQTLVEHNLGFCPWVWVPNSEGSTDGDGVSDFDQQLDNLDALDAAYSDAFKSGHYNADPTLVLCTDQNVKDVKTGSGVAIQLSPAGKADLLEMSGTGTTVMNQEADRLRESVLEDCHCVLDEGQVQAAKTATELLKRMELMYDRVDQLRGLYGKGMERAVEMLLASARVAGFVIEGMKPPAVDDVSIVWSEHVQMTPADKLSTVQQVTGAVASRLLSRRTAVEKLAAIFNIEDVDEELKRLAEEAKQGQADGVESLSQVRGLIDRLKAERDIEDQADDEGDDLPGAKDDEGEDGKAA